MPLHVAVTLPPAATVDGLTPSVGPVAPGVITRLKDVARLSGLLVTVIGKVPVVVVDGVEMVNVLVHAGLHDVVLNPAVAPLGTPEAENVTGCVVPACKVAVIVVVPPLPCTAEIGPALPSE